MTSTPRLGPDARDLVEGGDGIGVGEAEYRTRPALTLKLKTPEGELWKPYHSR